MTLVNSDELKSYMGGLELTTAQTAIVDQVILPGVQQDLENYLGRPVEPVIVREGLRPDDKGFLWFRVTPIHEIVSVVRSDGSTVTLEQTPVAPSISNPDDLRVYNEWGTPELFGYQLSTFSIGYIGYPTMVAPPYYLATYTAGYNGYVNEALKLDILRVSARECEMQFDDTMSLRGGQTEAASDSDTRMKGWTEDELRKWDRLRRRVAV